MTRGTLAIVTWIAALLFAVGCDHAAESARVVGPPQLSVGGEGDDTDCPDEIDPADCDEATWDERLDIYFDIEIAIKWYVPVCADIGEQMQDFALTGDLRTWPALGAGTIRGYWQAWTDTQNIRRRRVSFDRQLWTQGWTNDRRETALHEAIHLWADAAGHTVVDYFFGECINN